MHNTDHRPLLQSRVNPNSTQSQLFGTYTPYFKLKEQLLIYPGASTRSLSTEYTKDRGDFPIVYSGRNWTVDPSSLVHPVPKTLWESHWTTPDNQPSIDLRSIHIYSSTSLPLCWCYMPSPSMYAAQLSSDYGETYSVGCIGKNTLSAITTTEYLVGIWPRYITDLLCRASLWLVPI